MATNRVFVFARLRMRENWVFIAANVPYRGNWLPLETWRTAGGRELVFARVCYDKAGADAKMNARGAGLMDGPDLYCVIEGDSVVATVWKPSVTAGIGLILRDNKNVLVPEGSSAEAIKVKLRSMLDAQGAAIEPHRDNEMFADFVLDV